jgi:hypothetical protein
MTATNLSFLIAANAGSLVVPTGTIHAVNNVNSHLCWPLTDCVRLLIVLVLHRRAVDAPPAKLGIIFQAQVHAQETLIIVIHTMVLFAISVTQDTTLQLLWIHVFSNSLVVSMIQVSVRTAQHPLLLKIVDAWSKAVSPMIILDVPSASMTSSLYLTMSVAYHSVPSFKTTSASTVQRITF